MSLRYLLANRDCFVAGYTSLQASSNKSPIHKLLPYQARRTHSHTVVTSQVRASCEVVAFVPQAGCCSDALHCCNYSACMRCRVCLSSGCTCNDGKAGDSGNTSYSSSRWCLFYEWYFTRAGTIVCMYLWPIWPGPHHHFVLQSMTQGLLLPIAKYSLCHWQDASSKL